MMNKIKPSYSTNYTHRIGSISSQMSIMKFNFQNNHENPSSGNLTSSDYTIFRGSFRSCSVN